MTATITGVAAEDRPHRVAVHRTPGLDGRPGWRWTAACGCGWVWPRAAATEATARAAADRHLTRQAAS